MAAPPPAPWVILGRVLRFAPDEVLEAEEEEAQVQYADVVVPEVEDVVAEEEEEAEEEPHFTLSVVRPPRVTIVEAGLGAHPNPDFPDRYPYIIAAGPQCLLAHFGDGLFRGTYFRNLPHRETHLVLVRNFETPVDFGPTTASAVHIPDRIGAPFLCNIGNIGLYSDDYGRYKIAELQLQRGFEAATIVCFQSTNYGHAVWHVKHVVHPMAQVNRNWVPHGAVTLHSTIWWFDLSWGILSCDIDDEDPDLQFHHVPDGRVLTAATPDIHTKRCITVSRNKLRYAEIVTDGGGARLCMWTRRIGPDGWTWYVKNAMNFEILWDDDSYVRTGLPRSVPVLAAVCPSDPNHVCFALEQRIFGVNVRSRRVVSNQPYELANIPGPQQPASSRYVVAWDLPPAFAQALGMDAGLDEQPLPETSAEDPAPEEEEIDFVAP
ncbi:uncharacterized protein [Setaria viridis]|uniref:DUF1618 domain-containing protein n=1 Tax=Setaria viridis TaxID=4556 RepID=A0A4U6UYY0_SETVI|nr:uncharacterized protein LOC117853467 [Setaria viridis]TKW21142.1 hypothetical protein SEVIR_4G180800v2 [Setaria viridis]